MEFPTLRIELSGLKQQVVHGFTDRMDEIKNYAIRAIDASMTKLTDDGLEIAITNAVLTTMRNAIDEGIKDAVEEAVSEYFSSGDGKTFIVDAVVKSIKKGTRPHD